MSSTKVSFFSVDSSPLIGHGFRVSVGQLLKAWRQSLPLTQEQMAAAIDMDRGQYAAMEVDKNSPTVSTLVRVIAAIEKTSIPLGATDELKLSRFFLGPSHDDALGRFEEAAKDVLKVRKARKR
jgi:transcriptional regulator with XRE-family HTH domain